jgi:hypothetical protein
MLHGVFLAVMQQLVFTVHFL